MYLVVLIVLSDVPSLKLPPDLHLGGVRTLNGALELSAFAEHRRLEILSLQSKGT